MNILKQVVRGLIYGVMTALALLFTALIIVGVAHSDKELFVVGTLFVGPPVLIVIVSLAVDVWMWAFSKE